MRSTVAWVAILILAGAVIFAWQRSQIVRLRAQVARQGDVLDDLSLRLGGGTHGALVAPVSQTAPRARMALLADETGVDARADERRLILDEYRDVLAQMNLPPETASRLQDLLTDRVETVLDAQDAAVREGFAEGSAQMARAVSLAIAQVDSDIVGLVGQDGIRRIDGLPAVQQAEPAVVPVAPAPVIVTVVVQAPSSPVVAYADSAAQPAASDANSQFVSYPYSYYPLYSIAAFPNESRGRRAVSGPRNFDVRPHRNPAIFTVR